MSETVRFKKGSIKYKIRVLLFRAAFGLYIFRSDKHLSSYALHANIIHAILHVKWPLKLTPEQKVKWANTFLFLICYHKTS